jgi:serpin B
MGYQEPVTRRSWLASMLGLAVVGATVGGCGGGSSGGGSSGGKGFELVGSSRGRQAADPATLTVAVTAVQDFAAEAFRVLATSGTGNLVMSPLSIHLALTMTLLGARGATATEMLSALHAPDAAALAGGSNALSAALARRAGKVQLDSERTVTVDLEIADALWGQKGIAWSPAYLDALAADFGAGMRVVDYTGHAEQARRAINGWVREVTRDTVPELIGAGVLDPATRLTLVNALYLRAPWSDPFEPDQTSDGDFTRADGTRVRAPLMHRTGSAEYAAGNGWQAVRLGYADGRLAMTLVLPAAGRAADVVRTLDGARLREILTAPQPAGVQLTMPRWRSRSALELNALLAQLGMPTAFTDAADFTGMTTTAEPLEISAVVHQGYIAVDEKGTEASAATAVAMRVTGFARTETVTFDRPFLYVLHDGQTGAPLFIGRVDDPTAG